MNPGDLTDEPARVYGVDFSAAAADAFEELLGAGAIVRAQ